jgi:group I intron endonuclease
MATTIYAIQNKVNKKIYVGRSDNPKQRLKTHLSNLKNGTHNIEDMQEDYNKYGDVFDLFILEENVGFRDEYIEYKYMKKYRTSEREYGYNYKDHIAKRITFGLPKEIACKTEAEIAIPFDSIKTEYICRIVEGLNQTNDVSLYDFILQLITKSNTSVQAPTE